MRRLDDAERDKVVDAFDRYLETIPKTKRFRGIAYDVKDVVGKTGFGIGSAGLPALHRADRGIQSGAGQRRGAVDQAGQRRRTEPCGRRPRRARVLQAPRPPHRRVAARAAGARRPLLGYTDIDGVGYVVSEISPYEADLDWSELTEPDELTEVIEQLGQAVAKVHCVSDTDSDQTSGRLPNRGGDRRSDRRRASTTSSPTWWIFGLEYAATVRDDHRHFVEAFREGRIPGVSST